jgi:hypothetical protein
MNVEADSPRPGFLAAQRQEPLMSSLRNWIRSARISSLYAQDHGKRAQVHPSMHANEVPGLIPGTRACWVSDERHLSSCTIVVPGSTGANAYSRLGHRDLCEPSQPVRTGRKNDWCTSWPPLTSIRLHRANTIPSSASTSCSGPSSDGIVSRISYLDSHRSSLSTRCHMVVCGVVAHVGASVVAAMCEDVVLLAR